MRKIASRFLYFRERLCPLMAVHKNSSRFLNPHTATGGNSKMTKVMPCEWAEHAPSLVGRLLNGAHSGLRHRFFSPMVLSTCLSNSKSDVGMCARRRQMFRSFPFDNLVWIAIPKISLHIISNCTLISARSSIKAGFYSVGCFRVQRIELIDGPLKEAEIESAFPFGKDSAWWGYQRNGMRLQQLCFPKRTINVRRHR